MDTDWKTILANGGFLLLAALAYSLREWVSEKKRQAKEAEDERKRKADREEERERTARLENKLDGNTALCATQLVSSGNLPKAAPCIPEVAKALSADAASSKSACEYATAATAVAHDTMAREGIPQAHDVLVQKLAAMLEETRAKEERHNQRNAENAKVWEAELERVKAEVSALKRSPG